MTYARLSWKRRLATRAVLTARRVPTFRLALDNSLFEAGLCLLLFPHRMKLHGISLDDVLPGAAEAPVTLTGLPHGDWGTPLHDLVPLLKLATAQRPRRVLELGSYKGWTALYLARQCGPETSIVAIDVDPDHGEAYSDQPEAARIERRVGQIDTSMFSPAEFGCFDLIFVDADHGYNAVKRDSELALELITPDGFIVWHDYGNYGAFVDRNEVPEYLGELARSRAVRHVQHSGVAVYSPSWDRP